MSRPPILPRAPVITSTTDFVVVVFVVTVATILMLATVMTIAAAAFTERDVSQTQNALLDITTTIIGSLIGFIAGKGQGRSEMHHEIQAIGEMQQVHAGKK